MAHPLLRGRKDVLPGHTPSRLPPTSLSLLPPSKSCMKRKLFWGFVFLHYFVLSMHILEMEASALEEEYVGCRVGTRRGALLPFSEYPPPNLACTFQRTRLSSIIGVIPSENAIPFFS